MGAEVIALFATGLFFGAALYISLVEHPARIEAGIDVALRQFPLSYRRAARLQASAAVVGSLAALAAWLLGATYLWALSAVLLFAVVPLTLLVIFATNKVLHALADRPTDPQPQKVSPAGGDSTGSGRWQALAPMRCS